ncbi:diguanylate cyclase domain-containing protein [Neptuniibacter halophilus]|uniref:diguanylate cyclase domain-containing protein n=1 Tax=Neptuniibacter halophilus TaxID=651666 RepID=UPI00257332DF|nr:diguanylate cyclase [Neptuniibacter halophilus]
MKDTPVVLIVDDMPSNIKVLANCLKEEYEIRAATSGQACLQQLQAGPVPDLILLDIEMPDINGLEVCKQLKALPRLKDVPVIFVTAWGEERDEELSFELGAVDYITKPVRPSVVRARVNTHVTLKKQQEKLREMVLKDSLTGLYSRYYLLETAVKRMAEAERHSLPLSLVLFNLDHFKQINNHYGYMQADKVLSQLGDHLLQNLRKGDLPARFGGETFILLLEQCDLKAAEEKAEALRQSIEQLEPEKIRLTCSMAVAQYQSGEAIEQWLGRCDQALAEAKRLGRNRVCPTG